MKKRIAFLSLLIASAVLIGALLPVTAVADGETYELRNVTAYLYDLDHSETLTCAFFPDLPDEPYVSVVDYLSRTYTTAYEETEDGSGRHVISNEYGKMTVDCAKETVTFNNYFTFSSYGADQEGTSLDSPFCEDGETQIVSEPKDLTIELANYHFDLVSIGGKCYFPLSVLSGLFTVSYNAAEYVNGNLYFLHTMENRACDGYFDKRSLYDSLERDPAMAAYTYDVLCFTMDLLYGRPMKSSLSADIGDKGLDRTLEDNERAAGIKELLLSNDLLDFFAGMAALDALLFDGGHTVMYAEQLKESGAYPDTEFAGFWNAIMTNTSTDPRATTVINGIGYSSVQSMPTLVIGSQRDQALEAYEQVRSWPMGEGQIVLTVHGDTALFTFDSFYNEVIEPFKWSLDYAVEKGLKNFVLDLSNNGGGSSAVLLYLLGMMTHSADVDMVNLETVSNTTTRVGTRLDLNLDGVFDEQDDAVSYDLNFAVLTTKKSFSCGNLLPVLAKAEGILILGQTSGGGECAITKQYLPGGHYFYMSCCHKFPAVNGRAVDLGAEVDYDLAVVTNEQEVGAFGKVTLYDYSGLYDIDNLSAKIREFYLPAGDINGDGEVDAVDYILLKKLILGTLEPSPEQEKRMDVNGDGETDARDYILLKKIVLAA